MRSLVVLFALVAAAVAAPSIGHVVAYIAPAAVSHQSRVDIHSSPALVAAPVEYDSVVSEPVLAPRTVVATPVVTEQLVGPAVFEARSVYGAPISAVYTPSVYGSYW